MSPSTNQVVPVQVFATSRSAVRRRGPQQAAAGARGRRAARAVGGRRAGRARRGARAVPGRRDARDRAHPLRDHRPHADGGRHRAAAGASTRRGCSASTASPTASSSTATARTRSRVEWEIVHAPERGGGRRGAPGRLQPRRPLGRAALRRAERARRGRRRRARRPRAPRSPRTASGSRGCCTSARPRPRTASSGARTSRASSPSPARRSPPPRSSCSPRRRSRSAGAAVPRRDPRLGVGRRVGRAEPLHPPRTPSPLPHLPSSWEELTDRLPRGRRRPQRGLLRRPGHPRGIGQRPRRPLAGELPQQRARRPRAHPRRRARRHRLPRPRGVRGRPDPLARLPGRGPPRPPRSPHRAAAAARHRVPPAAVVPLRGVRHVQPARSDACVPAGLRPQGPAAARPVLRRGVVAIIRGCSCGSPTPTAQYSAVRLTSDLPAAGLRAPRRRVAAGARRADVERLEYQLEVEHDDGATEYVLDPGNPNTAPGRVRRQVGAAAPDLRAARMAGRAPRRGRRHAKLAVRARADARSGARPTPTRTEPLPLLVAHDGPEYDQLAAA